MIVKDFYAAQGFLEKDYVFPIERLRFSHRKITFFPLKGYGGQTVHIGE